MSRSAGFTLLETLVALALMGLILLVVLGALGQAAEGARRAREHSTAMALAQSGMEDLLAMDAARLRAPDRRQGRFPSPFEHYEYAASVRPLDSRELTELRMVVRWQDGSVVLTTRRRVGLVPEGP